MAQAISDPVSVTPPTRMDRTMVMALSGVRRGASAWVARTLPSSAGGRLRIPVVLTWPAVSAGSASPQLIQANTDMETATRQDPRPPMPLKKPTSSGMPSILTVIAR